MDTSTKNEMNTKQDLGMHRKNGEEEQKGMESIRQNSSSIQEYFQQSQWTSRTYNLEGEWGNDHHSNPIGCSLPPVHDQFKLPKENSKEKNKEKSRGIYETGEITFSAPKPNLPIDNYNGTNSRKSAKNNQCLLEIGSGKDYQPCIWCISYRQHGRQERFVHNPARERQIPFSSGSIWKCDPKTSRMGVRELLGNECLDLFMPVETRSPNQVYNDIIKQKRNDGTMQKLQGYLELVDVLKNDREFREFHESRDEWLFDQEIREYINKTYGIPNIYPLFVDCSGMVVLFLDDRGIMFRWSEMIGMYILRVNKLEGLANYLYNPEKICAIIEDTGELVPEVEFTRRIKEKRSRKKLEKEKLAKEKKLAREKKLVKEK